MQRFARECEHLRRSGQRNSSRDRHRTGLAFNSPTLGSASGLKRKRKTRNLSRRHFATTTHPKISQLRHAVVLKPTFAVTEYARISSSCGCRESLRGFRYALNSSFRSGPSHQPKWRTHARIRDVPSRFVGTLRLMVNSIMGTSQSSYDFNAIASRHGINLKDVAPATKEQQRLDELRTTLLRKDVPYPIGPERARDYLKAAERVFLFESVLYAMKRLN